MSLNQSHSHGITNRSVLELDLNRVQNNTLQHEFGELVQNRGKTIILNNELTGHSSIHSSINMYKINIITPRQSIANVIENPISRTIEGEMLSIPVRMSVQTEKIFENLKQSCLKKYSETRKSIPLDHAMDVVVILEVWVTCA